MKIKDKLKMPRAAKKALAKQAAAQKTGNEVTSDRLELMFTVVNRSKTEFYVDLIHTFDVNMQMVVLAEGTADAHMLSLLGLADNEKSVIISAVRGDKIEAISEALEDRFAKIKNGKGISFTIPMTSVIGTLIFGFLSNNRLTVKENK